MAVKTHDYGDIKWRIRDLSQGKKDDLLHFLLGWGYSEQTERSEIHTAMRRFLELEDRGNG